MDNYITGNTIKRLREKKQLTQSELASLLNVSDKTVSKWETGRGLPDISLIEDLASVLGVSVIELMSGNEVLNLNKSSNLLKTKFYVCPICGNIISSVGDAVISCCGITLPPLEPVSYRYRTTAPESIEDVNEKSHFISIEKVEDQLFVSLNHEMTKKHSISFIAAVLDNSVQIFKQYPEWNPEVRIEPRFARHIYVYCNKDGLFKFVL